MSKKGWGKMKKFLLASVCLFATAVMAQDLFPELAGLGNRPKAQAQTNEETEETFSEENIITTQQVEDEEIEEIAELSENEKQIEIVPINTKNTIGLGEVAAPEEEEEEEDQKIQIYMADANATITPNDNFSFCSGQIKFASTMKYPVQNLEVTLTYGSFSNTYVVSNLNKNEEQAVSITLVGKACEHIMDMPQMEVKRCVADRMSEDKCKQAVEFIPLRGA